MIVDNRVGIIDFIEDSAVCLRCQEKCDLTKGQVGCGRILFLGTIYVIKAYDAVD